MYMFWITFGFNFQFYSKEGLEPVVTYIEKNGGLHLAVLLFLAIALAGLFVLYSYKDSKRVEMFDNGHDVSFVPKDNFFSMVRTAQYVFLALLIIDLVTCLLRLVSLDPTLPYTKIYERGMMILGFEFLALYALVFVGSLVIELIRERRHTYH